MSLNVMCVYVSSEYVSHRVMYVLISSRGHVRRVRDKKGGRPGPRADSRPPSHGVSPVPLEFDYCILMFRGEQGASRRPVLRHVSNKHAGWGFSIEFLRWIFGREGYDESCSTPPVACLANGEMLVFIAPTLFGPSAAV